MLLLLYQQWAEKEGEGEGKRERGGGGWVQQQKSKVAIAPPPPPFSIGNQLARTTLDSSHRPREHRRGHDTISIRIIVFATAWSLDIKIIASQFVPLSIYDGDSRYDTDGGEAFGSPSAQNPSSPTLPPSSGPSSLTAREEGGGGGVRTETIPCWPPPPLRPENPTGHRLFLPHIHLPQTADTAPPILLFPPPLHGRFISQTDSPFPRKKGKGK